MSKGEVFRTFKTCEQQLARAGFTLNGDRLVPDDNIRLANALCLWGLLLVDIGRMTGLSRSYSAAAVTRWLRRLPSVDIATVVAGLKSLLKGLRDRCSYTYRPFASFQREVRGMAQSAELDILLPVLYEFGRRATAFSFLMANCALQFVLRLTLEEPPGDTTQEEFISLQREMKSWEFCDSITAEMKEAYKSLFWDIDPRGSIPKFSGGATVEVGRGKGRQQKMKAPISIRNLIGLRRLNVDTLIDALEVNVCPAPLCSRYQLVPKSITGKRGICMEPSWTNYLQQALFACMDTFFQTHDVGIRLHDQHLNAELALRGSADRSLSTLDLKAASDRVSWSLVKKLTSGSRLLPFLLLSRSPKVEMETDEGVVWLELQSYAGMGNSTTFPIESMVFRSAVRVLERRHSRHITAAVYGDDIVVESQFAEELIELLSTLKFVINNEKSFVATRFTESCGVEAYSGFDVSPLRIPRRYDALRVRKRNSAEAYVGTIDLINRCFAYGFILTRGYLLRDLLRTHPQTYFSSPGASVGVWSNSTDRNFHLKRRFNLNIYEEEYLVDVPKCIVQCGNSELRYLSTLDRYRSVKRNALLDPDDRIEEAIGASLTAVRKQWVAHEDPLGVWSDWLSLRTGAAWGSIESDPLAPRLNRKS